MVFDAKDNEKLVSEFGAKPISSLKNLPSHPAFTNGLVYSHRDLDSFLKALEAKKKCAIVSGLNASGTIHLGHKGVFDINLYFQKQGCDVFIPISDDESYVSGKVDTQKQALENAYALAKELLALGFDPKKTFFIIDQITTSIYNLAIRFSRRITLSEVRATYGYTNDQNPGLFFYPSIQTAHVLLPLTQDYDHVLVPIGPDEDAHLRIARDIARKEGIRLPSVLHMRFLPGLDGEKMSKSKGNFINLNEEEKAVKKKVMRAFSGGAQTLEEQRKNGGNPDVDVAFLYLKYFFTSKDEAQKLAQDYKAGKILSGEMKQLLAQKLVDFLKTFHAQLAKTAQKDVEKCLLKNW